MVICRRNSKRPRGGRHGHVRYGIQACIEAPAQPVPAPPVIWILYKFLFKFSHLFQDGDSRFQEVFGFSAVRALNARSVQFSRLAVCLLLKGPSRPRWSSLQVRACTSRGTVLVRTSFYSAHSTDIKISACLPLKKDFGLPTREASAGYFQKFKRRTQSPGILQK